MTGCCYLVAGQKCEREVTAARLVPARTDLPCPDSFQLHLCYRHSKAFDMWQGSQRIREADARARR